MAEETQKKEKEKIGEKQFVVLESAYNKDFASANLAAKDIKPYSRETAAMAEYVEELDRYDDFADLHIDPSVYKKNEANGYGIEVRLGVNDSVILEHQQKAATKFLKELRGFGLLADVVGSGKTYEASVILSELAVRGKVRSLLVVAPEQVYNNWVNVLETQFGLGNGVLLDAGDDVFAALSNNAVKTERVKGDYIRPLRPLIVTTENFVKWKEESARLFFDVIIVDEAHNLCTEEGEYARAMKLLSLMMRTKKEDNSTFCLLLSATPHSGNLEHMFRLWYFIRCKGGNPSDFDEKDDKLRTEDYLKEKKYYKEHVCRGATTVMEFIQKVKLAEVTQNNLRVKGSFDGWIAQKNIKDFYSLTESEKLPFVNDFLNENEDIKAVVLKSVAGAYHNGVLRSIMIRQPNEAIHKEKNIVNYLYFPMSGDPAKIQTKGLRDEKITVDMANLNGDGAISTGRAKYSVKEYVRGVTKDAAEFDYSGKYAELMVSKILHEAGLNPGEDKYENKYFIKQGTQAYYWQQFADSANNADINVMPFNADKESAFLHKLQTTKDVLKRHTGRVLIFFDYEKQEKDAFERRECTVDRLVKELKKDRSLKGRIFDETNKTDDKKYAEEQFNKNDGTILIVRDKAFTEGANLQKSNVIINFEVPSDPLAMDQRIGRVFRLGQDSDVTIYSLADMSALEGYVLMYFTSIELMSSNSGDATIIAGSNNERMVTVRCDACGNVKLLSQEEYEERRRKGGIYCNATARCRQDNPEDGTLMQEISVCNFKCDVCGQVFERSVAEEGYYCVAINNTSKGVMCNSGESGDKKFYCKKICAMNNCSKFNTGELKGKCNALIRYRENKNISDCELMECCELCAYKSLCPPDCRFGIGIQAIEACMECDNAGCRPKPHVIQFNEEWTADCPVCGKKGIRGKYGKLKPVQARTFDAFIRGAWDYKHDGGAAFCTNFLKESEKVKEIKQILGMDNYNN